MNLKVWTLPEFITSGETYDIKKIWIITDSDGLFAKYL